MAIPDYQSLMLPLLRYAADGEAHFLRDAYSDLADEFGLTEEERKELLPSGRQQVINNRIGWAKTYMVKAGLFEMVKRGCFKITDRGKSVLTQKVDRIDVQFLRQYPEFLEFQSTPETEKGDGSHDGGGTPALVINPEESLERAYLGLRRNLSNELLDTVKSGTPAFFESLVVDLIVGMGYGGSRKEAGEAVGKSNDEGIDGIIKEDRLGLDIIYVQAKRWENTVGRPEIQKFAGALQGKRAKKGIFITTSSFSKDALEYANLIDSKIILIDGERLAELMIDHNVGVATVAAYEVKRVDTDYFEEG